MKELPKEIEFAAKLLEVVADALSDDINDNHIEFSDDDMTEFIHALTNVMPTMFYNRITGNELNNLEFNHLANRLCFQFMKEN